jgi:hypothetical protein
MSEFKDEPGVFFVARDLDYGSQGFSIGVGLIGSYTVDGPFYSRLAAVQAAEEIQSHGTYRVYRGDPVHVVTVERPQVTSETI